MAKMEIFPKSGDYTITSNPIFVVTQGGQREVVVMDAVLTLRTGNAYESPESKKRKVDLEIINWEARGTSKLLGTDIVLRMQHDEGAARMSQKSFVEAKERGGKDFPAEAQFVLPYEMETAMGVIKGLTGITRGAIRSFPPRPNDMFQMEKFEAVWGGGGDTAGLTEDEPTDGEITPVLCAC